jgi:hypothetical protein
MPNDATIPNTFVVKLMNPLDDPLNTKILLIPSDFPLSSIKNGEAIDYF